MPSRSDAEVRLASEADAADVARLLDDFNVEFNTETPGAAVLTQRLDRLLASGEVTVLLTGRGPDGFALLRFRPGIVTEGLDAHLEEFYVVPARRGRGLGRALLEAAMEEARRRGARRIDLGTSEDDTAARALYESFGFTNIEEGTEAARMLYYERDL